MLNKLNSFIFIPFPVTISLFFRVKPIFPQARDIVLALISPDQSSAISLESSPLAWANFEFLPVSK
jgi:hypothetical protein